MLSQWISSVPLGPLIPDIGLSFQGVRLFEGHDDHGSVFLAEFSALPSMPDVGLPRPTGWDSGCFLSNDGKIFRQMRTVSRNEGLVLTETPGFPPMLISFRELHPKLIFENPKPRPGVVKPNMEIVHLETARLAGARGRLSQSLFHYFRRDV